VIEIHTADQAQTMPWKNGKGSTKQILIEPKTAQFPNDHFLWRLSSAPILEDGLFSLFPGYQRLLMVIQGAGIKLNGRIILPNLAYSFSGDQKTTAELFTEPVIDLGLIFDPKRIAASMNKVVFPDTERLKLEINPFETHLIYWAKGYGTLSGHGMEAGSVARIHSETSLDLYQDVTSLVIHVQITSF
jgi:environmental stress-induced protein Ves